MSASDACSLSNVAARSGVANRIMPNVPLAIISAMVRFSSSLTPGVACGGYSTMDVPGWPLGPTVSQRMPA